MCDRESDITNGDCVWLFIMQNDPDDPFLVEIVKGEKVQNVIKVGGEKYFHEFIDLSTDIITEYNHQGFLN